MKRMVVAVVALVTTGAWAQGLKDFLDASEQQNVDRKISIEQRNVAAAQFTQAWTALLPSLTAQAAWQHNQYKAEPALPNGMGGVTTLVIQPYDQFSAAFRFELPLIDTTKWMRILSADSSEKAASAREEVMRDAVRKQVVAAYYNYAASLALLESAKKSANVADAQLKLTTIRNSAGTVTELDLLRSKAEVARTKQTVADVTTLVGTSRRTLRTLTGLEPPDQVAQPADDVRPEADLATLEARIEELPAVKAADFDREAAGRAATTSKLALVPIVTAQFTEQVSNVTGFTGQATAFNTGIGLVWRLDVPTFMGMRVQDGLERTSVLAGDRARLAARDQINSDWQRLNAALIKIEAAQAQVESAQRAAQVARDRYAVGAATQVDVIQAERDVFGAEVSQIQARAELATVRASLRISAALPLQ